MRSAALPASSTCPRCGVQLQAFTLELPIGLGPRTLQDECRCEQERRAAEARERMTAARQARIRQLLRQSGIGLRHREASFATFVCDPSNAGVVEVCEAFTASFPQSGKGLTLAGPPGTGKTHLGVAITRALIDRGLAAILVNVPRLLLAFRETFHGEQPQRFEQMLDLLCCFDHLLLDDLGRERTTEWVQETLYLVINARYEDCLATSVTTNLAPDELRRRLGEPILDRLAETNDAYWCQWPSYRRRPRP